ncbi:MAG TPA: hypothetical protein VK615_06530 [Candidatus Binatia bacterium]|nr:hypothetical protein [Candidatus Binatia bacterium]
MNGLTVEAIDASSDEELFSLLGKELERRISAQRGSSEFLAEIRALPIGLRAMAGTYELDVSLALDDLGWHFGNWHSTDLAEETARGLEEVGAADLAKIFRDAFQIAQQYWIELGAEDWMNWYHGSPLETAVEPLTKKAWSIRDKNQGIFKYWVDYARRHPERVGAPEA